MKKEYSKPVIVFENFQLVMSIAGACKYYPTHDNIDSCGYAEESSEDAQILFANNNICTIPMEDKPDTEFCYHVPVDAYGLFQS